MTIRNSPRHRRQWKEWELIMILKTPLRDITDRHCRILHRTTSVLVTKRISLERTYYNKDNDEKNKYILNKYKDQMKW